MLSVALAEWTVLEALEPRLRQQGYTVIREPSPEQRPSFLKDIQPDAIAIGRKPFLVIQVLPRRSGSADTKVAQLQGLFEGQDDWRLEVVYAAPDGTPLEAVTSEDIRAALDQARRLADTEPKAGLLVAWATLEAIARILEPTLASRSLSSGSLVDLLIANGHVPQSEGARLRRLGDLRNKVTHGQINVTPLVDDVRYLTRTGDGLIR